MSLRDSVLTLTDAKDPERLARVVSRALTDTSQALNGGLTFADHFQAQWMEFNFVVPTLTGNVAADAVRSTAQSIPTATVTVVDFATVSKDTDSAVTTGAAWKFTCPAGKAGRYAIQASVALVGIPAAAADLSLLIYKNGTTIRRGGETNLTASQGAIWTGHISATLDLAAGDYLDVRVLQYTGANRNTEAATDGNWVSITRIDNDPNASAVPAACWPKDFVCTLGARPSGVFVAEIRELATNANFSHQGLDWDWITKKDATGTPVPHVRIRNIAGLPGGKTYRVRLLAVLE